MNTQNLTWFTQSSVRLYIDERNIYIDPYKLDNSEELAKADFILITHSHFDHLSMEDINKIVKDNTIFYAPSDVCKELRDFKYVNVVNPSDTIKIDTLTIQTVPAYNLVKKDLHPKENNWVGYIISGSDGYKIYHTGDTEFVPEMKNLDVDFVMLPLGQTYTMNNVEEAVTLVKAVKAKKVMPFHYGLYEGSVEDKNKFSKLLENENIEII